MAKKCLKNLFFTFGLIGFFIFIFFLITAYYFPQKPFARANNRLFLSQENDLAAIQKVKKSVVTIIKAKDITKVIFNQKTKKAQIKTDFSQIIGGSGFFLTSDGLIVTNKHVVEEKGPYYVILDNGQVFPAKIVARDPLRDLAFLKIKGKNFPAVQLGDSSRLKVGETVFAIGYALGRYPNSVSKGIISGLHRYLVANDFDKPESLSNLIQTDAALNPGNSGGALINLKGQVIGITTAIAGGQDVGFALPSNLIKTAWQSYRKNKEILRPELGIHYVTVTPLLAKFIGLPRQNGAWIHNSNGPAVLPDSPAARAGLRDNDIIFEVNAIKVTPQRPLEAIINLYQPGQTIGLKVQRGNKIIILKVKLGAFRPSR